MSTNAYIMMEHEPTPITGETITCIYSHWDGYIEGVGETLFKHYQDYEKVKALIELGDISSLGEFLSPKEGETHTFVEPAPNTTVAYHRDRGDNYDDVKPKEFTEFAVKELAGKWGLQEYNYLYGLDKKWYLIKVNTETNKFDRIDLLWLM